MMFAATYAIARMTATARLIRRSYVQWYASGFTRRRAAVLAVKYFGFYN